MNGAISNNVGRSVSCVWAELANDYGNGLDDTGQLHLIGNIGWNLTGRCLTLFIGDVEREGCLFSNYNNWVVGSPTEFIVVEDNVFYTGPNSQPRQTFTNLSDWKLLNKDLNSKSEDPKFIAPIRVRTKKNGYAIDLNLLPVSPVLGMVPSFAYNATAAEVWIPSYVDTSLIAKDILRNNRSQAGTAAGSNEKASTAGFYGQDIFSNPLDLDITKDCGADSFSNLLFKSLDLWFPKLKRGYFYSNEREYYLYSKKQTSTIGAIAVTSFSLPASLVHNKEITVKVSGKEIDLSYIDLTKNTLILYHRDLTIITGEEEIEIAGWISNWNGDAFNYNKVLYIFKIKEGDTKYLLPDSYVNVGPVVVTDDKAYPTDSDYISNREFALDFDSEMGLSEVVFANHTNLITNCQFDYTATGSHPLFWQSYLATVLPASTTIPSVAGVNICSLPDQGYIRKLLPISTTQGYSFSFHSISAGSGVVNWNVKYYDANYDSLGQVDTGSIPLQSTWTRNAFLFNSTGQDFDTLVPKVPYACTQLSTYYPPTRAAYCSIQLEHNYNPAYTGNMFLDAIQYEATNVPTLYHRRLFFNEMTVEYESSVDSEFVDTHLSISPVTNLISDGFIYIPEIPAITYGGPNSPAITTLHEWKWPHGRQFIIPWARTKGKDKLRKRPRNRFSLIPDVKPEMITPVNFSATIREVEIVPTTPTTFVGDENGVGFTIRCTDSDGNPHANNDIYLTLVDNNLKYPGLLFKKLYGLKEQLGPKISSKTDSSGSLAAVWIPPLDDSGIFRGKVPVPSLTSINSDLISVVKTEYPVSLSSYGNVIILDYQGKALPTKATQPIVGDYLPVVTNNTSIIRLKYPVVNGSVKVIIDDIQYTENQTNLLDSNQFFVDYENSLVTVKGRVTNITLEYLPSYIYISQVDPYKIMLYHEQIFDTYDNTITLSYDFSIKLNVSVHDPANTTFFNQDFDLIAQNSLFQKSSVFSSIALEF